MGKSSKRTYQKQKPKGKGKTHQEKTESYETKTPIWSFSKMDTEHPKWSLGCCENIYKSVLTKLSHFETMRWGDIKRISKGGENSKGSKHHNIPIESIISDAQERLTELKIDDIDNVFSFGLEGRLRVFGIIRETGVFEFLWYDKEHEICPSHKSHT